MRHSSWTLFLVPLALPLVLLCCPGGTTVSHRSAPAVESAQEPVLQADSLAPEAASLPSLEDSGADPDSVSAEQRG